MGLASRDERDRESTVLVETPPDVLRIRLDQRHLADGTGRYGTWCLTSRQWDVLHGARSAQGAVAGVRPGRRHRVRLELAARGQTRPFRTGCEGLLGDRLHQRQCR